MFSGQHAYAWWAIAEPNSPIDINNCTEDDLANLPGISVVQAKKAIQHREMNGMYISLEQLDVYKRQQHCRPPDIAAWNLL